MGTHNRRSFLKGAGATVITLGFNGCTTAARELQPDSAPQEIRVQVKSPSDPLIDRSIAIFKSRVEERCSARVLEAKHRADIILTVDQHLPLEAFRIDKKGSAVRIAGGSPRGLLYGIGKFLRTSTYQSTFQPSPWRGISEPQGSMRGMYFASHFHNWYHQASEAEMARYMEDLALWGVNAIMVIFPMINLQGWDDPEAEPAMAMVRKSARTARELGLQFVTGLNNCMFIGAPQDIRATRLPDPTKRRGNSGHPICPSNPQGHEYLMTNTRLLYEKLQEVGLDAVCYWPYDEGGCACEKCAPWGSNAYVKLNRDLTVLGREYFPNLQTIVSTWMFDTPPEGEWQGLTDALKKENDWADYILADSHEDFPRYPLDVGVPGGLPLLNFPEISMWGNWPWGGMGAHPLPARFQRLWDQVKQAVSGGFPYSEGIYEDMNKAVVVQFYWNRDQSARTTLAEYINYEFSPDVTNDVLTLIDLLETAASRAARKEPANTVDAQRALDLAEQVHAQLPEWARKNWRWEILHLRAIIDRERFGGGGLESPTAETAMLRLVEIYHSQLDTNDPYHHRVRPPLRSAVDRAGKK